MATKRASKHYRRLIGQINAKLYDDGVCEIMSTNLFLALAFPIDEDILLWCCQAAKKGATVPSLSDWMRERKRREHAAS